MCCGRLSFLKKDHRKFELIIVPSGTDYVFQGLADIGGVDGDPFSESRLGIRR